MPEDAGGIRRVVLACGTVDLRRGINGLEQSSGTNTVRILLRKEPSSFSAGSGLTAARACSGWGRGSCFYIKGLKTGSCPGPGRHRKPPGLQKNNTIT